MVLACGSEEAFDDSIVVATEELAYGSEETFYDIRNVAQSNWSWTLDFGLSHWHGHLAIVVHEPDQQ